MLTSIYAFAWRPRWILSHLLVLAGIITMVGLGFWQLDRLDQRQSRNEQVTERLYEPITDIDSLVSPIDDYRVGAKVSFRRVSARGEYQVTDQVLIHNRSFKGAPGFWVFTPLLLEEGTAIVVNRGWVPFSFGLDEALSNAESPAGNVSVVGLLRETVTAEGLQSADPATGMLSALARPDLARLEAQLDYEILPVYLQLEEQYPNDLDWPLKLPPPELDEGPHLAYAVQWFVFVAIGLLGYPLVLRKVARDEAANNQNRHIPVEYL